MKDGLKTCIKEGDVVVFLDGPARITFDFPCFGHGMITKMGQGKNKDKVRVKYHEGNGELKTRLVFPVHCLIVKYIPTDWRD